MLTCRDGGRLDWCRRWDLNASTVLITRKLLILQMARYTQFPALGKSWYVLSTRLHVNLRKSFRACTQFHFDA